ncbi:prohead protease/major capsid protein fusion protein [Rhizobium glycinendophyticum]|uniref:Peptidase U35 n=1 Tax=Rhizobium glycinendophyticum TaxID=2589807 RepID=A0A504UPN0_9HYPH|nr:prohead protease/major capsid protein fusion protein [Rhizobium glycinendophyticum]TPP07023.1 peptidase U35 [Rhizobium glycinendophyticum]
MTDTILHRALPAGSTTLDLEARTVEIIFATEQPVRRRSPWEGQYDEILVVTAAAIDAGRMGNMSVLDSHRAGSLADRLGSVVPQSLKIARGEARCTIRLSRSEKAELLLQDLRDGHTLPISVGYRIHEEKRTEAPSGGVATVRATKWEPLEISFVPIPADAGAMTRELENEGNTDMTDTQTAPQTRAERKRVTEITNLARSAKIDLGDELVTTAIAEGTSLDGFRAAMLDHLIAKEEQSPTFPISETRGMRQQRSFAAAAVDALMIRIDHRHKPETDARELVGLTVPEIARRCIENLGESTHGLTPASLVTRALHSTSDFPEIMSNLAGKTLQAEFAQTPAALKAVSRQSSARDFKAKTRVKLSTGPELEKVTESGEYKRGTMFEDSESYRIDTFGKIFGITRQALINDDLGAFSSAATKMGQAAAVFEAKFLVQLLESNPTMNDGKAVFHNDHRNLLTASTLNIEGLTSARLAFRKQTGLAGDLVNIAPRFLVVPAELETTAEKLLTEINATKLEDVNPFSRRLELVVEPRLTNATAWYLAADPAQAEGLEYSYLEGFESPYVEYRAGFDVDGVEIKVRLDFGAAFLEHRSWMKNPGTV